MSSETVQVNEGENFEVKLKVKTKDNTVCDDEFSPCSKLRVDIEIDETQATGPKYVKPTFTQDNKYLRGL